MNPYSHHICGIRVDDGSAVSRRCLDVTRSADPDGSPNGRVFLNAQRMYLTEDEARELRDALTEILGDPVTENAPASPPARFDPALAHARTEAYKALTFGQGAGRPSPLEIREQIGYLLTAAVPQEPTS